MEDFQHIFIILVILNFVQGISCDDNYDALYGLITASAITGVLLCVLIVLAVLFALRPDYHKKSQLKKGKCKIPRSWLDYERDAKYAQKQRIKQQIKYQRKLKRSGMIKQNDVHDMEMQNIHRSRPQIPGSWRREGRHSNGYIVTEVPTLQRTNQQLRPVLAEVSGNDHAVWQLGQPTSGLRYSDITNASTEIRITPPCDINSSSSSYSGSADSTLKVSGKRRFKSEQHKDEEVIEATLHFKNNYDGVVEQHNDEEVIEATLDFKNDYDGVVYVDDKEVQEKTTAF